MLKTKSTYTLSPGEQKFLELILSEKPDVQEQIGLVEPAAKIVKLGFGFRKNQTKRNRAFQKEPNNNPTCNHYNRRSTRHERGFSKVATFEIFTLSDTTAAKTFQSSDSKKTIIHIEKSIERAAKSEIYHIILKHENLSN